MSSKKSRPLDDPPAASSSEEEVESEEEEEESEEEQEVPEKPQPKQSQSEEEEDPSEDSADEETEDEDEEEQQKKKNKQNQTPPPISTNSKKIPQPEPSSESDSLKSPRASDFTIKPISPSTAEEKLETPVSKPSAKRRAENGKASSKTKKAKSLSEEVEEEGIEPASTPSERKSFINRLWSEEDEIAILKGVIEFQAKKGKDVSTHQNEFYEYVNKSFHVDVSRSQLADKVRRMKKKFKTSVEKSPNGENHVFSKAHDNKCFQLCKKIWGEKNVDDMPIALRIQEKLSNNEKPSIGRGSRKSNTDIIAITAKEEGLVKVKSEKVELIQGKDEEEDLGKIYPFVLSAFQPDYMSNLPAPDFLKSNLSLLGSSQLKEMNSQWQKQIAVELEVYMGRVDLVQEQTRMVLDAINSMKN